ASNFPCCASPIRFPPSAASSAKPSTPARFSHASAASGGAQHEIDAHRIEGKDDLAVVAPLQHAGIKKRMHVAVHRLHLALAARPPGSTSHRRRSWRE